MQRTDRDALRQAAINLALAAGKLNVALDGQKKYERHRQAVLDAMKGLMDALKSIGEDGLDRAGLEQAGWDWLDQKVSALCNEHPSDIVYSADQMVDAYVAGILAALRNQSPDRGEG